MLTIKLTVLTLLLTLNIFLTFFNISIVAFEHVEHGERIFS